MAILSKVGAVTTEQPKFPKLSQFYQSIKQIVVRKLFDQGWLLYMIGFFLGRAIILSSLSPFALAFLATTIITRKQSAFTVFMFLSMGAITVSIQQTMYIVVSGIILMFIYKLFLNKMARITSPVIAATLVSSVIGRGVFYVLEGSIVMYDAAILATEAVLSAFLIMIFYNHSLTCLIKGQR
nr:hypothetical protein [Piscibacillus salipiscarius]